MAIELATQFQAYTDEQFYSESKTSLVTNKDFSFDGAKTIKLYKVKTTDMEDFNRNGPILDGNKSQYGTISTLQATTEAFTITKDRSFTFEVDKMDTDETKMQVAAASALARQQREKVFPEIDSYVYSVMAAKAGMRFTSAACQMKSLPPRSGRTALTMWEKPERTPSQAQKRPRNRLFTATVPNPRALQTYAHTACRPGPVPSAPAV